MVGKITSQGSFWWEDYLPFYNDSEFFSTYRSYVAGASNSINFTMVGRFPTKTLYGKTTYKHPHHDIYPYY